MRAVRPFFTAEALFTGRKAAEWRADYAGAHDWGPAAGRAVVPA